jgi:hypothetical protein
MFILNHLPIYLNHIIISLPKVQKYWLLYSLPLSRIRALFSSFLVCASIPLPLLPR